MSITIRRSIGKMGNVTKMQIIVNREKVAVINEGQILKVELPDDENILKVRHFGIKSNEIEVRDGEILEIERNRWHLMLFPLILTITFIAIFIPGTTYTSTILPIHVLFLIIVFVTKGFSIKKII